jgi:hypothetical protein
MNAASINILMDAIRFMVVELAPRSSATAGEISPSSAPSKTTASAPTITEASVIQRPGSRSVAVSAATD